MDIEEKEDFDRRNNASQALFEYFSNPNKDLKQLVDMLKLYDKHFYHINKTVLIYSEYDEVIERFKDISMMIANTLSTIDNKTNQAIGHILLQQAFEQGVEISKKPSLLQYFFYEQCQKNNISYQPMESMVDIMKGANTTPDNVIQIGKGLGNKQKDVINKNVFVLFAILHEIEHLKHKLANKSGDYTEQLFNLLSRIQPLEDGFYIGNPSHRIAQHTEFPDEIFADVVACEYLFDELRENYGFSVKDMDNIKRFLKELGSKLLIRNGCEEYSPTEYLAKFIQERLVGRFDKFSPTEQERVEVFLQEYSRIQNSKLKV